MRATNQDLARRPRSFVRAAVTAAAALGRRLRRPRRRTSPPSWLVGAPQACRRSEVCRTASALTTTSSPPLLLAPQARWRQHAVLALPGPCRLDCSFARHQVRGAALHTLACSHGVLKRRAHTARSSRRTHNSTPGRRRRGRVLSSPEAQARSDQIIALPSVPRQEGHWATARASTARSEVNYFASISGKLVELDAFGTQSVRRPRLAPAPPLTQHRSCAHPWQAPRPRDGRCRS